jgi:Golgi nucleoside diphosphatase
MEGKESALLLDSEVFRHIEPGLSSFKDDPKTGAESLIPLLEEALRVVPDVSQKETPINLKATAGEISSFRALEKKDSFVYNLL